MSRLRELFNCGWFKSRPQGIEKPAPTFADLQQHLSVNQYLRDSLAEANVTIAQLSFLLSAAPMIDMFPYDWTGQTRMATVQSPFAYVHPKTLAPFVQGNPPSRWYSFPGSRTKWIPMSSMPEGRVIFSPSSIPGVTV